MSSIQHVASATRARSGASLAVEQATSGPRCAAAARCARGPVRRGASDRSSARILSKPSAVIMPAVTSSHSAVSTSAFSFPVPRTISAKNEAPRCAQMSQHLARGCAETDAIRFGVAVRVARNHPVRVFANEKCNRRNAGGNHAAIRIARFASRVAGCGERRPQPTAPVRQRLIENFRDRNSRCVAQGFAAPRHSRAPRSLGAAASTSSVPRSPRSCVLGRDVLPAQQPAHELRRGHRLNLLAQSAERQPMNAREQTAVAPFDFARAMSPVKRPRRMEPLASRRKSVFSMSFGAIPRKSPRAAAVIGPRCAIQPVMQAMQRIFARRRRASTSGRGESKCAAGKSAANVAAFSAATQ